MYSYQYNNIYDLHRTISLYQKKVGLLPKAKLTCAIGYICNYLIKKGQPIDISKKAQS